MSLLLTTPPVWLLAAAAGGTNSVLGTVGLIITGLFGAGGIGAITKYLIDKKRGVVADEISENSALDARVQLLLDNQVKFIITPLQLKVDELENRQTSMQAELDLLKGRYQSSLKYIRKLRTWIVTHLPELVQTAPEPPEELKDEI